MANPKRIDFTDADYPRSGITIEYVKSRDVIHVSGWYDTFVGIEGRDITRAEFERQLGIPSTPPRAGIPEEGRDDESRNDQSGTRGVTT